MPLLSKCKLCRRSNQLVPIGRGLWICTTCKSSLDTIANTPDTVARPVQRKGYQSPKKR